MLVIVVTISKGDKKMISGPDTITRGFVFVKNAEELLNNVNKIVETTVTDLLEAEIHSWNIIKQSIKKEAGQFLFHHTKRNPMIIPIIIEISRYFFRMLC